MPAHDWTRVTAGIFHDFRHSWIEELRRSLNGGRIPDKHYTLVEQLDRTFGSDVLATEADLGFGVSAADESGGLTAEAEMDWYARKQSTVVVRHSSDDRIVALIDVVSPGNKASQHALRSFVDKAAYALDRGYHLLLLDLHAPGPHDPNGIHGALWSEIANDKYRQPADKPLTLAAYVAAPESTQAYVEPVAVGDTLADMPLFLQPTAYVTVPLEQTYQAAFRAVPQRWRRVLEPPGSSA